MDSSLVLLPGKLPTPMVPPGSSMSMCWLYQVVRMSLNYAAERIDTDFLSSGSDEINSLDLGLRIVWRSVLDL